MKFRPNMTSQREGITVIGDLQCRVWDGVIADLWHAELGAGARGEYVGGYPRLFVLLEEIGGPFQTRLSPEAGPVEAAGNLSFVPAGLPLYGQCDVHSEIRHLDLHIDPAKLEARLGEDFDAAALERPRLMFHDDRIFALARLIAEECSASRACHDLYGESLTLALFIDLFGVARREERRRTPLADWQLRRVTEFIEANYERAIRLQELADLVDLSQSYFSHAFKAATGLPPHRWQMNERVRRAKLLLMTGTDTLADVAAKTGFSDQAHLTRAFRQLSGSTPGAWQKANRGTLREAGQSARLKPATLDGGLD
jgi:AraC family transcriptional regulator